MAGKYYHRFADGDSDKIQKGLANTHTSIIRMVMSADAQATITFTDTVHTYVIDVRPGTNKFKYELAFAPDQDVTITIAGGNVSIFADTFTH